jgi:enolase-phosphatase E1
MSKLHLFDIEGTTTDINFVHQVLFPYSLQHMDHFVREHVDHPVASRAIEDVKQTVEQEEGRSIGLEEVIQKLLQWIKQDRKHGALKEIQGLIWDLGYSRNHFQGHVYADVKPCFERILNSGEKRIGIYSSGSVHAQKLIFGYSTAGDLTPYISFYFDTKIGPKRESASYSKIAEATGLTAQEICFYSDVPEELQAARAAGMQVMQVVRPGTHGSSFPQLSSLDELSF